MTPSNTIRSYTAF